MSENLLCIYHGNCADGFTAAWAVRCWAISRRVDVDFHAGVYQSPPPDVAGRDVLLVDFSYKRAVIEDMAKVARSILILDHHKTAAEDLSAFVSVGDFLLEDWLKAAHESVNVGVVFDLERSGAGITWDFLFPGAPRHPLVNYVEDRDLWRFRLPNTREIQAAIFSYPYDFNVWHMLADSLLLDGGETLATEGRAIERKHHKDVAELTGVVTRPMRFRYPFDGHSKEIVVPISNLPYTLTSDAGHLLAENYPFAGCYWDTPEGRVFSLRSREDGADVGEIAKLYGGGGHKHASGFRVPFDQLAQFEP